jgi:hypothetical protein
MISLDAINTALEVVSAPSSPDHPNATSPMSNTNNDNETHLMDECHNSVLSFKNRVRNEVLLLKIDMIPPETEVYALAEQLSGMDTLDYLEFKKILNNKQNQQQQQHESIPKDIRKYLSAKTFLTLPKDEHGCVRTEDLLKFVTKSMDVEEVGLNLYRHCMTDDDDLETPRFSGVGVYTVSQAQAASSLKPSWNDTYLN